MVKGNLNQQQKGEQMISKEEYLKLIRGFDFLRECSDAGIFRIILNVTHDVLNKTQQEREMRTNEI